jgi:hypothetical protein
MKPSQEVLEALRNGVDISFHRDKNDTGLRGELPVIKTQGLTARGQSERIDSSRYIPAQVFMCTVDGILLPFLIPGDGQQDAEGVLPSANVERGGDRCHPLVLGDNALIDLWECDPPLRLQVPEFAGCYFFGSRADIRLPGNAHG